MKKMAGAGRKPKSPSGERAIAVSVRLAPEIYEGIVTRARSANKPESVSQVVSDLLKYGLEKKRDANQAIGDLITTLGSEIEKHTGRSWLHDPYASTAFYWAALHLLIKIRCEGESVVPERIIEESAVRELNDKARLDSLIARYPHLSDEKVKTIAEADRLARELDTRPEQQGNDILRRLLDSMEMPDSPSDEIATLCERLFAKPEKIQPRRKRE